MSLKQGLMQLREYARARGMKFYPDQKGIIIPIYSFINQLVTSMKNFLNSQQYPYWYIYLVSQHLRDRSFPNVISKFLLQKMKESWQKLSVTSLECNLLQSLLVVNNKNKLKLYLKARKFIIQTASNSTMLDEILLNVQDAISVIHKLYQNQHIRRALVQGIKNIFMAFKLTQAKIYSSVFIEYLLTVYDSIFRIENDEATISGNFSNYKSFQNSQNYIELYSSISNFQSGMHDENGLYKKTNFTQNTPKKYQIIDRKFIPLKQTSQFVSNQNANKMSSSPKKFRQSVDKEKSSFYGFINQTSKQGDHQVSHEQSSIKHINSFSKSYEKQHYYFLEKQAIQRRNQNSIHDKENNLHSHKVSMQRDPNKQVTKSNPKFSLNRPQIKPQPVENKTFSLNWFSKKLFETSGDEQRQSILRRSKERMKKTAQSRKKLHITSQDSTQKYEIQNHLLNQKNKSNHQDSLFEPQNHQNHNRNKTQQKYSQSEAESVKKMQFDMMVSKNQQFKQKMLKKNYPSNTSSEYTINSHKMQGFPRQFTSNQTNGNNNFSANNNNFSRGQQNLSGVYYQHPKNNKKATHQPMLKKDYLQEKNVYPSRIMTVKERSQMSQNSKSANNLSRNNIQKLSSQQYPNFTKKNNNIMQQNQQQFQQKPQIIHKSIGKSRLNNFSNNYQQKNQLSFEKNVFEQNENQVENQQQSQFLQKSSFNIDKMKKMIRIIDDYRQKNDSQSERSQQQINISSSICKKSNFDSNLNPDFQEMENYSFY